MISKLSETLKNLLGVGLINLKDEFLKTTCNTDSRISRHELFHSLIVNGMYVFGFFSTRHVLNVICVECNLCFLIDRTYNSHVFGTHIRGVFGTQYNVYDGGPLQN